MLSETPLKMRATRYLRILSGEYGVRDAACPVSTGCGTRRVRSVRGAGRGVSGQYGVRDAACPVSTGCGTQRVRFVWGVLSASRRASLSHSTCAGSGSLS